MISMTTPRPSISTWPCMLTITLMRKIALQLENAGGQVPETRLQGAIIRAVPTTNIMSRPGVIGVMENKRAITVNSRADATGMSHTRHARQMAPQHRAMTSRVGRQKRRPKKEEAGHPGMNQVAREGKDRGKRQHPSLGVDGRRAPSSLMVIPHLSQR